MKSPVKSKIVLVGALVAVATIAVFVYFTAANNKKFKTEGIKTQATILEKFSKRRKTSSYYYFKISYFTVPEEKSKPNTPQNTKKEKKSTDEIIESLGKDYKNTRLIGTYLTTEIDIFSDEYHALNTGDKIDIYYLKSDSLSVRLAKYVEK